MIGYRFAKFDPMTYVLHYRKGRIVREGKGLSFWYYQPNSSIVAIPLSSVDVPFIFEESTSDYQKITIQGQLSFRVSDPERLAELLDFTVNGQGKYRTDDPLQLPQRLVNEAQSSLAAGMEELGLRDSLRAHQQMETWIRDGLTLSEGVQLLGLSILNVNVLSIRPQPDMARTLEAETRELLLQEADEAIYARRRFSVEQERSIKETELNTEIAVEEKKKAIAAKKMEAQLEEAAKKRELREMAINADVSVERQRRELVEIKTTNAKSLADAEAYRLEKSLVHFADMDWRKIAILQGHSDPQQFLAIALTELAENLPEIGTINIAPDWADKLQHILQVGPGQNQRT